MGHPKTSEVSRTSEVLDPGPAIDRQPLAAYAWVISWTLAYEAIVTTSLDHPEASNPEPVPVIEQRSAPRFSLLQRCLVLPPGSKGTEGWRCIAYNISLTGIGITLPAPLQTGTILEVVAWGLPAAPVLKARVVHARFTDFLWFCGCELVTSLEPEQLQAWLMGPHDWVPQE